MHYNIGLVILLTKMTKSLSNFNIKLCICLLCILYPYFAKQQWNSDVLGATGKKGGGGGHILEYITTNKLNFEMHILIKHTKKTIALWAASYRSCRGMQPSATIYFSILQCTAYLH